MPSHIFTRLGLWPESIQSNLASAAAAHKYVAMSHPGAAAFDQLHAMDYLVYAYLQRAQDREAKRMLDQVNAFTKVDSEIFSSAYAFAAVPACYALERRRWSEPAQIAFHTGNFPSRQFPFAAQIVSFARVRGAAQSILPAA